MEVESLERLRGFILAAHGQMPQRRPVDNLQMTPDAATLESRQNSLTGPLAAQDLGCMITLGRWTHGRGLDTLLLPYPMSDELMQCMSYRLPETMANSIPPMRAI